MKVNVDTCTFKYSLTKIYGPIVFVLALFSIEVSTAQNGPNTYNFLLNQFNFNPAMTGNHNCVDLKVMNYSTYNGLPDSPQNSTLTVHKGINKFKTYNEAWQGVGALITRENVGAFTTLRLFGSFAYHKKLTSKLIFSSGLFVGFNQYSLNTNTLTGYGYDPAINGSKPVYTFPNFVPGIWMYTRKDYMGLSVFNLYKDVKKLGSRFIGSPSTSAPIFYFTYGRRIESKAYQYVFMPAMHMRYEAGNAPVVDLVVLWYIMQRIGVGVGTRIGDSVNGQLQYKISKKLSVAITYAAVTSAMKYNKVNSFEFVFTYTPCDKKYNADPIHLCPAYN